MLPPVWYLTIAIGLACSRKQVLVFHDCDVCGSSWVLSRSVFAEYPWSPYSGLARWWIIVVRLSPVIQSFLFQSTPKEQRGISESVIQRNRHPQGMFGESVSWSLLLNCKRPWAQPLHWSRNVAVRLLCLVQFGLFCTQSFLLRQEKGT